MTTVPLNTDRPHTAHLERASTPVLDAQLSRRLDEIICALEDEQSSTLRRAWLQLQKLMAERHVPAFEPWKEAGQ